MTSLTAMSQAAFERFLERIVPEYASEKVEAGNWPLEGSLERSQAEFEKNLPDGLRTPKNFLYTINHDDLEVGAIWLAGVDDQPKGFIYELCVDEANRGRGIAYAAMRLLESEALRHGFTSLGLHVFGRNRIAQRLYERLGFAVTNINMVKTLEQT